MNSQIERVRAGNVFPAFLIEIWNEWMKSEEKSRKQIWCL